MLALSRRAFLASGAAALLQPGAASGADFFDVIVIGAGAAGIAAARRVAASGRRAVILEASDRIGGRCLTDTQSFGVPCDLGAHWFYRSDINPMVKLGREAGQSLYETPLRLRLRVGGRFAREGELESYFAALVRASRSFAEASRARDVAAGRALPKELGEWRSTIEFALGPLLGGADLDKISAQDLAFAAERDKPAFCQQGAGVLAQKLAEKLTVTLSAPVRRIVIARGIVYVETPKGTLRGRAAIVTAPVAVLAAEKIRFDPGLPKSHADALAKLVPGHHERVVLELRGNPLGLDRDDFVLEKANDARTAALIANMAGTPLCFVELPGENGKTLLGQGENAMRAFAVDWLVSLFGSDIRSAVGRMRTTRWGKEQWALGATTVAAPGGRSARVALMQPVRERIFFAGEAVHETLWGTLDGAWESGERAAADAVKWMSGGAAPTRKPGRRPARKPDSTSIISEPPSGRLDRRF